MELLQYIALGALAGTAASLVLEVRTISGLLMDMLLGIFGAITGGVILYLLGQPDGLVTGFDQYGSLFAVLGAIAWIWVGSSLELDKTNELGGEKMYDETERRI